MHQRRRISTAGLGAFRRAFGWDGRLVKRFTGADEARLRPSLGRGGLAWSLSLAKRF